MRRVYEEIKNAISETEGSEAVTGEGESKKVGDLADFYISAEGGDEFGLMILPKEGVDISLNNLNLKIGERGVSEESFGDLINKKINDSLKNIDFEKEGIVEKEKIKRQTLDYYFEYYNKQVEEIKGAGEEDIDSRLKKYEIMVLERHSADSLEELDLQTKREELLNIFDEQKEEKISEIDERFEKYEFFASASAGYCSGEELKTEEATREVNDKTMEIIDKKDDDISDEEAKKLSKMSYIFDRADESMNAEKKTFKMQARSARQLGSHEPGSDRYWLSEEGASLATHMLVLSRSNEQMELMFELEDIYDENSHLEERRDMLREKVRELKAELKRSEERIEELESSLAECEKKLED